MTQIIQENSMLKKVILNIINVVSVLIIVLAVVVMLSVLMTDSGQAPSVLGYSMFRVTTGSMEPTISVDSLIVVHQTDLDELEVGDVISFYSQDPSLAGMVNTHRIVSIEQDGEHTYFTTRGDANNVDDRYVTTQEEFIGKVIFSSYRLGLLVRMVSNPLIFVPLILGPLAVMLITNLHQTVSLAKKIAREEEEAAVLEAIEEIQHRKQQAESNT
jgi:signal peptidase I